MKLKNYLFFLIAVLFCNLNIAWGQNITTTYDPSDGVFYLKTGDGHEDYVVDGTLTFKCTKNTTITTCSDAGVCFSPKNEGEVIQVTIDEIDLDGSNNYLLLYNGYFETKYPMPSGWFDKIGINALGNTYTSGSADGKFTIGFHSACSSSTQKGFTITVRNIVAPDMEYKSTNVFLNSTSVVRDANNQILLGLNVASETIKTLQEILPLTATITSTWARINAGDPIDIYPTSVSGGVQPYTYKWKNAKNEVLSTEEHLIVSPDVVNQYTFTVSDAEGTQKTLRTVVPVTGGTQIATFENLYLSPESYWQGYEDTEETLFYSGSYSFTNMYYPSYGFWGGFAYSNVTSTAFNPSQFLEHQFRSTVGHGVDESENYAVLFTMGAQTEIKPMNTTDGETVAGVYLANAAYAYDSMTNGDSFAGVPFTSGDYFKVIFKGTTDTGSTNTVEYYLADYRSANSSDWFILNDWKWFDLSSLGKVTKISISLDGSRKDAYGLLTPAYLCMDNLGAEDPTLSIEDINKTASSLQIYPVPTQDILYVKTNFNNYELKVYNLSGGLVISQKSSGSTQINVSSLPAGIYILETKTNTNKETRKFIKK
ncbi:MAG: DUF4465 domain-containing protein [Flavobacteriaceae bacterium]|jgi:hypothetical protein|nr:DUF4465 domain-containing protein [Flavobacteriaceae bacterium]